MKFILLLVMIAAPVHAAFGSQEEDLLVLERDLYCENDLHQAITIEMNSAAECEEPKETRSWWIIIDSKNSTVTNCGTDAYETCKNDPRSFTRKYVFDSAIGGITGFSIHDMDSARGKILYGEFGSLATIDTIFIRKDLSVVKTNALLMESGKILQFISRYRCVEK